MARDLAQLTAMRATPFERFERPRDAREDDSPSDSPPLGHRGSGSAVFARRSSGRDGQASAQRSSAPHPNPNNPNGRGGQALARRSSVGSSPPAGSSQHAGSSVGSNSDVQLRGHEPLVVSRVSSSGSRQTGHEPLVVSSFGERKAEAIVSTLSEEWRRHNQVSTK